MRTNLLLLLSLCCSMDLYSQLYLFNPNEVYQTLPDEGYTINQVDITPLNTEDTVLITYRLVENTCPNEWEFILCDWSACFDDMPNTDDMDPLPPGYQALIKITANAHLTAGAGLLRFWIFPTGQMELHEDLVFHYNTAGVTTPQAMQNVVSIRTRENGWQVQSNTSGDWFVYLPTGQRVQTFHQTNDIWIPLDQSPLYFVQTPSGKTLKISR